MDPFFFREPTLVSLEDPMAFQEHTLGPIYSPGPQDAIVENEGFGLGFAKLKKMQCHLGGDCQNE